GTEYSLFDIQRLYGCRRYLSTRQEQAVRLFLYEDKREREVALAMGVSPANPVAIYATQGLKRLAQIYDSGFAIPGGDDHGAEEPESDAAPAWNMPRAGGAGRRAAAA